MISLQEFLSRTGLTNILSAARNLHMMNTGSYEASDEEYWKLYNGLDLKLKSWQETILEKHKKFDDAVKNLLEVVLEESKS